MIKQAMIIAALATAGTASAGPITQKEASFCKAYRVYAEAVMFARQAGVSGETLA